MAESLNNQGPGALPRVSIIMPVLNAAGLLDNCLASVARQTYPRDRYEIVIADGGSTDGSQQIALRYGARVIDDRASRHMEDSKRVALTTCTGEYVVYLDADNEFTHPDYMALAVRALEANPQALGVEAYYLESPKMTRFCAYLTEGLHISDPLCWMMSVEPVLVKREGEVERWRMPAGSLSYPLGANGFVYRRADLEMAGAGQQFQDTHIAIRLMELGKTEWLRISGRGVHHYYTDNLKGLLLKRRRAMVHFLNVKKEFGAVWLDKKPPVPGWAACLYCASVLAPMFHALKGWRRTGKRYWLWHVPASLASVGGAVWGWFTHRRHAHNRKLVSQLQPRQTVK
jgi:glycosyltransferase involved in cell wall biosynthesis